MRTRILMFGWEFPPFNSGGLGVACFGLTRALAGLGLEVAFVMPKRLAISSPWTRIIFADMPVEVEGIAVSSYLSPYLSKIGYGITRNAAGEIYGWDLLEEVRRYAATGAQIARQEQFDIIYAHDWLSFGAGMEAQRVSGKPLIVHVHATEYDRCGGTAGMNPDVYATEKLGMEKATLVIAVSELTKNIIIKHYGISGEKIRVVHNGIDDSTMPKGNGDISRLRMLKASGNKLVLFLGRVTLQKGPDYFIRTAQKVLERNPKVFFILSGSGDMHASMMDLAARMGIGHRMLFTGHLQGSERHEMYKAADLFVMPSVSEPFGITPLEAMKLGTPVLISKQSGVSEIVKHVLKADFWDVDEMANKILSLVGYDGLRQTLSQHGMLEADEITWSDAGKKVDSIIKELVH